MVRGYVILFIVGVPFSAVVCLFAGLPELALALAGIYWMAYRLTKRLVLTVVALFLLLSGAARDASERRLATRRARVRAT